MAAHQAGAGPAGPGRLPATQLASGDARAVLAIAPSPAEGMRVSAARVETALPRGGRQRRAASIVTELRTPQLRQERWVEQAMRTRILALLSVLDAVRGPAVQLAAALAGAFRQHPDYEIITSFPDLAVISGAIVLVETGDDRDRLNDDRELRAFAGSAPSPVPRASRAP